MVLETDVDLIQLEEVFEPDLEHLSEILSRLTGEQIEPKDLTNRLDETFGRITKTINTLPNKDYIKQWS